MVLLLQSYMYCCTAPPSHVTHTTAVAGAAAVGELSSRKTLRQLLLVCLLLEQQAIVGVPIVWLGGMNWLKARA